MLCCSLWRRAAAFKLNLINFLLCTPSLRCACRSVRVWLPPPCYQHGSFFVFKVSIYTTHQVHLNSFQTGWFFFKATRNFLFLIYSGGSWRGRSKVLFWVTRHQTGEQLLSSGCQTPHLTKISFIFWLRRRKDKWIVSVFLRVVTATLVHDTPFQLVRNIT